MDEVYPLALGLVSGGIGILVGLEVPILLRILEAGSSVRVAVSQVLAVDYIGALIGSLLFPLLFLPYLGLVRTSAMLGLLNLAVAFLALHIMREEISRRKPLIWAGSMIGALLIGVFLTAGWTTSWAEDRSALFDVMLCDPEMDIDRVRQVLCEALGAGRYEARQVSRVYQSGELQSSSGRAITSARMSRPR
jgi:predicted membrane-bound spermidine synthase